MDIDGISAIVTGGASGLGEGTVRALANAGATVTIVDLNTERGEQVAHEVGGKFVRADVTDETQLGLAVQTANAENNLRIAVSCAGFAIVERTLDREGAPHSQNSFEAVIAVNLVGTFNLLRLAASAMVTTEPLEDGERGVIVNTASVAAFEGQIGQIAYAASKGGVAAMTLPAARDLSIVGIRVCALAPGIFDTPLLAGLPEKAREGLAASIPFPKRLGAPAEYASLILEIARNRMLNGEIIRIDGALRMAPK